jgi:hypothetical protein
VKTVSGIVNMDGAPNPITASAAYTSERVGPGEYKISFPAGTWQSFPVMTASPWGIAGNVGSAVVTYAIGLGDGSAEFGVMIFGTADAVGPFDNAFMFIATASLP